MEGAAQGLEKTAIKPVLVNPYDLKIIALAKFKDDNRDSERLSDLARGDFYKPSYVPSEKEMDLRELVRTRLDLRHDATKRKNHAHAILVKYPLKRPAYLYTAKGREWLRTAPVRDYDWMVLDAHLTILDVVEQWISLLERESCSIAVTDPRTKLLMTMPGVVPVTAVTVLAEIGDDLARFTKPEKLTSYAGLVPSHRNSADTVRTGGVTKRGSRHLRNAAVEAAFVAVRYDPHRKQRYERLAARRGPQKALVAAAREILEDIWYMLTGNEPYNHPNEALTRHKMANTGRLANRDVV